MLFLGLFLDGAARPEDDAMQLDAVVLGAMQQGGKSFVVNAMVAGCAGVYPEAIADAVHKRDVVVARHQDLRLQTGDDFAGLLGWSSR